MPKSRSAPSLNTSTRRCADTLDHGDGPRDLIQAEEACHTFQGLSLLSLSLLFSVFRPLCVIFCSRTQNHAISEANRMKFLGRTTAPSAPANYHRLKLERRIHTCMDNTLVNTWARSCSNSGSHDCSFSTKTGHHHLTPSSPHP